MKTLRLLVAALIIALPATLLMAGNARAVPSFARQTGLACSACHTVYPELTPMGRRFKLGGYTLTNTPWRVELTNDNLPAGATGQPPQKQLSLVELPPFSLFVQGSLTNWNQPPPPGGAGGLYPGAPAHTQNNQVQFPEAVSLFAAGAITDHIGAWLQLTYAQQAGTIGIDNQEIRYVDQTADKRLLWGVLANNGPTIQDVWNTGGPASGPSMAYAIPNYSTSLLLAAPVAPLMFSLGPGHAAGVGAYVFINDSIYLELTGYKAAQVGIGGPTNDSTISPDGVLADTVNPYWRAAYEKDWGNNSWEVGTIGMYNRWSPCTTTGCAPDLTSPGTYLDYGFDTQYQFIGDVHIFTINAMYMHEDSSNNAANVGAIFSNTQNHLDRFAATASYYYQRQYGGMIGFTSVTGSPDPLAYCAGTPGCSGSPDAMWETFELDYMPWLNVKVFLQYNLYNRLDSYANAFYGIPSSKVSDNNTLMLGIWTAF
jgi:hypothetical protein